MKFWSFVKNKLDESKKLMLLVVIDSSGSSPGRLGFKMAVASDGEMEGSVGGGTMEYAIVELGKAMLDLGRPGPVLKKQIHKIGPGEDKSGMICSGEQTIVIIGLDKEHKEAVNQIVENLNNEKSGVLKLSPDGFSFSPEATLSKPVVSRIRSEADWEFQQLVGHRNRICIIGAGHVGLALSKVMRDLEFVVEVFDNREHINTLENNIYAAKKHHVDYENIGKRVPQGKHVYVVIMTSEHQSDELVLSKLVGKKFKYLGLMGSRTKVDKIYKSIGYDPDSENSQKVHSPIGIPISSKTPMEIAVSIAAQVIQVKNRGDKEN